MIEIRKIKLCVPSYSWNWAGGQQQRNHTITENDRWIISEDDINKYKKTIKSLKGNIKSIPPKKRVYFESSVLFPRRKFTKYYPDNKVTFKAENADIIVIDPKKNDSEISRYYCQDLVPCGGPDKYTYSDYHHIATSTVKERFIVCNSETEANNIIKRINSLPEYEGKDMIDVKYICAKSDEVLDVEAFERLSMMLSGTDEAMRVMAMNLLTGYDYEKERYKIAMLLNLNWGFWSNTRDKKMNVEIKTMLHKLDQDYPGYNYQGYGQFSNKFWLESALTYPEDKVIQKAFNIWVKRMWPECPNIKILKNEEI
jgi:hypothetical protein